MRTPIPVHVLCYLTLMLIHPSVGHKPFCHHARNDCRSKLHVTKPKRYCPNTKTCKRLEDCVHSVQASSFLYIRGGGGNDASVSSASVNSFLEAVDLFGTGVFAFSGALTAGKKGMDLMGMCIIATITSVGGGTVRDLLLDSGTVFWMQQPIYLIICGLTTLATFALWPTLEKRLGWKDSAVPICTSDALGLAAFCVLGTQKAVGMGLHPLIWIVSGVMTSCFGGIVRDLLCRQPRPRILYPDRSLYATPPLIGSCVYMLLTLDARLDTAIVASISFLVTFICRVLCFNNPFRLPHWEVDDDPSAAAVSLEQQGRID